MDFSKSIQDAIEIVKLDEKTISDVSKDKDAWKFGLLIVAIGAVLGAIANYVLFNIFAQGASQAGLPFIGSLVQTVSLASIITAPIGALIGTFVGVAILLLFVKIFGGKANYMEHLGPLTLASILSWLSILNIIPVLGGIINFFAGIWGLVVAIMIVRKVNAFTTGRAVAAVLLPVVIIIVLAFLVGLIVAALIGIGTLGVLSSL